MSHGNVPAGGGGVVVVTGGVGVVDVDGGVDGVGEVVTVPEQVTPLSVNEDGTGLLPLHAPLNPKLVLAPEPMLALYDTFVTVTLAPDCVYDPFHNCVIVCPAGKLHANRHPVNASPRFVTVTFAPKPPDHDELTA